MASFELNDRTARELADAAAALGMTVEEFIRSRIVASSIPHAEFEADRFEQELNTLLHSGPSLPADFSRADIYVDHD